MTANAKMKVPPTNDLTRRAIASEFYFALSNLKAPDELLAIVGNWGDTAGDTVTLDHLRAFNRNGSMFKQGIGRI